MKVFGIPIEFIFFGLTLAGVGIFHQRSFEFAVGGMLVTLTYELTYKHLHLIAHLDHEWHLLVNLFGLLLGFAILARLFEDSNAPEWLTRFLPASWVGGWILLAGVALVSSFVDNIAAAILGGVLAKQLYKGRLRVGFLAAIVAASNAGGSFSPVGDTTTTMMWIAGVHPETLARAFFSVVAVVLFSGFFASRAQERFQPLEVSRREGLEVDWGRVVIVVAIIAFAIVANFLISMPAAGVWTAIVLGSLLRRAPWYEVPASMKGTIFLLSLVFTASMMPVKSLPSPSWQTATGLGYVSAVFDNIPLTALSIFQNGYDWGLLAFTIGYGGSMIWFGSSAGVGICNRFPEAKHTGSWIKEGWHIAVAYVIGVAVFMLLIGWKPIVIKQHHKTSSAPATITTAAAAPAQAPSRQLTAERKRHRLPHSGNRDQAPADASRILIQCSVSCSSAHGTGSPRHELSLRLEGSPRGEPSPSLRSQVRTPKRTTQTGRDRERTQ